MPPLHPCMRNGERGGCPLYAERRKPPLPLVRGTEKEGRVFQKTRPAFLREIPGMKNYRLSFKIARISSSVSTL